ncbi:MAG: 3-deoxy-8-phosphooctulonate synthase [Candidatus Magnetobacterium sp. LHC-1]
MMERFFDRKSLFVIAGPCVIESREVVLETARALRDISLRLDIPIIFKSSYDKANRTSINGYRGIGVENGLALLSEVRSTFGLPVITDVHSPQEALLAAEAVDVLQLPAFLCRQTDLILAAANTGKAVNIKKGQFLAPWDVKNIIDKFTSTGNTSLFITERGTTFGYNNLVVDFRAIPIMRAFGYPVLLDVTHSVQLPGGLGTASSGQRQFAPVMARAAAAVGVDGLFMEVHPQPDNALCDGPNMLELHTIEHMLSVVSAIHKIAQNCG